jgi:hypothetical protein
MCKEMMVTLVNRVVDPKRIIGKMEGRGGEEAQQKKTKKSDSQLSKLSKLSTLGSSFLYICKIY